MNKEVGKFSMTKMGKFSMTLDTRLILRLP